MHKSVNRGMGSYTFSGSAGDRGGNNGGGADERIKSRLISSFIILLVDDVNDDEDVVDADAAVGESIDVMLPVRGADGFTDKPVLPPLLFSLSSVAVGGGNMDANLAHTLL
jgi:hypothetical protein